MEYETEANLCTENFGFSSSDADKFTITTMTSYLNKLSTSIEYARRKTVKVDCRLKITLFWEVTLCSLVTASYPKVQVPSYLPVRELTRHTAVSISAAA
jgi:hypothetical protein